MNASNKFQCFVFWLNIHREQQPWNNALAIEKKNHNFSLKVF